MFANLSSNEVQIIEALKLKLLGSCSSSKPLELIVHPQSIVALANSEVFKILREVSFDFADLSTLEKRRNVTFREYEVGKMFSSGVYLGVEEVSMDSSGLTLPLAYALKMRRLSDQDRLLNIVKSGYVLDEIKVKQLISRICEIHQKGKAVNTDTNPALILRTRWEKQILESDWKEGLDILGVSSDKIFRLGYELLDQVKEDLKKRSQIGAIRELHGDIRPEHIYFEENFIQFIDPFVLDEKRRSGDVLADLAFLICDIYFLGSRKLANQLIKEYRAVTPWIESFEKVLGYFLFQRAAIMSYNLWLRSKESNVSRDSSLRDSKKYIEVALGGLNV